MYFCMQGNICPSFIFAPFALWADELKLDEFHCFELSFLTNNYVLANSRWEQTICKCRRVKIALYTVTVFKFVCLVFCRFSLVFNRSDRFFLWANNPKKLLWMITQKVVWYTKRLELRKRDFFYSNLMPQIVCLVRFQLHCFEITYLQLWTQLTRWSRSTCLTYFLLCVCIPGRDIDSHLTLSTATRYNGSLIT